MLNIEVIYPFSLYSICSCINRYIN